MRPVTHRLEVVDGAEDPEALARRRLLRRDRRRAFLHLPGAHTYTHVNRPPTNMHADIYVLLLLAGKLLVDRMGTDLAASTEHRTVASGVRRGRRSCTERRSAAPAPSGVVTRRDPAGE